MTRQGSRKTERDWAMFYSCTANSQEKRNRRRRRTVLWHILQKHRLDLLFLRLVGRQQTIVFAMIWCA